MILNTGLEARYIRRFEVVHVHGMGDKGTNGTNGAKRYRF